MRAASSDAGRVGLRWDDRGEIGESVVTNQPLCQLSYAGLLERSTAVAPRHITDSPGSIRGTAPWHNARAHSGATTN